MINLKDTNMLLPHDGYLKLWQLQRPRLKPFDIIMIDEAQDLTPGYMHSYKILLCFVMLMTSDI